MRWIEEGEKEEDLDITRKRYDEIYIRVERWYYDFGSHKFIQILTFRGGILKKIETGDYGGAKWDITGPDGTETVKEEETEASSELIYGRISVVGSPHGAEIYLNGLHVGNIPSRFEQMEAGAHQIVIKSKGYKDWVKRVIVKAGTTSYLSIYLEPEKAEIEETDNEESDRRGIPSVPSRKVYKWTDEKGHIHITDTPPASKSFEQD